MGVCAVWGCLGTGTEVAGVGVPGAPQYCQLVAVGEPSCSPLITGESPFTADISPEIVTLDATSQLWAKDFRGCGPS